MFISTRENKGNGYGITIRIYSQKGGKNYNITVKEEDGKLTPKQVYEYLKKLIGGIK